MQQAEELWRRDQQTIGVTIAGVASGRTACRPVQLALMKSVWTQHHGTRVLYCDLRDFGRDVGGLQAEVTAFEELLQREPLQSVLLLMDVRGTTASIEALDVVKRSAKRKRPYVLREAVVGVTGIQKILAQSVARFGAYSFQLFDSVDAALDWLTERGPAGTAIEPRR